MIVPFSNDTIKFWPKLIAAQFFERQWRAGDFEGPIHKKNKRKLKWHHDRKNKIAFGRAKSRDLVFEINPKENNLCLAEYKQLNRFTYFREISVV